GRTRPPRGAGHAEDQNLPGGAGRLGGAGKGPPGPGALPAARTRQPRHVVRSRGWIASLGSNRVPDGREQAYNLIEVVAQRLDDGTALTIGVQFDGLALFPSSFGERAVSEQASALESPYAVIEFGS